jgi:hypothetical protein
VHHLALLDLALVSRHVEDLFGLDSGLSPVVGLRPTMAVGSRPIEHRFVWLGR